MTTVFANILAASRQQKTPPRFVCMTTMGVGGTSFHIKLVLKLFVAGIKQIDDYERADKLVRRNGDVPYTPSCGRRTSWTARARACTSTA